MHGKIAIEEHFLPPELKDTIFGSIGWHEEEWLQVTGRLQETDEQRIADMDANGVAVSVLSLAAPCIQDLVDLGRAVDSARLANDRLAEVIERHPDRFAGLAALPMQDPAAAAEELDRAVSQLGFKGALVNGYSSVGDLETAAYYDEPQYDELWERVTALDVPFYLHPRNPLPNQRRIYAERPELLGPTWAFTMETAGHAMRMLVSGLFDRHPTLTVILGHMGELLPFSIERSAQRLGHIPSVSLQRSVSECFAENFYVTTSGNFHTPSLIGTILQIGADRILFAADYPFEDTAEAAAWFDAAPISEADRHKIGAENARRLLRL